MPQVQQLHPMLITNDLESTVAYYRDKLGFEVEWVFQEAGMFGYAALSLDGFGIRFREGELPPNPSSYGGLSIEVDDVDALFDTLKRRGALPEDYPKQYSYIREHPPEDKDYGVRDMFLVDPNGYILTFLTPLG